MLCFYIIFFDPNVVLQTIDIGETLALFMELQILGDRALRKLAFSHVVHSIRRMNQKHKNEAKNRKLQNILYAMLQVGNIYFSVVRNFPANLSVIPKNVYVALGRG